MAEFFVSGQLSGVLEERLIENMIDSFNDDYIVCGFGRVGPPPAVVRLDRMFQPPRGVSPRRGAVQGL